MSTRRMTIKRSRVIIALWGVGMLGETTPLPAQNGIHKTIWDVPGIYKTPRFRIVSKDSALGLEYEGLPYQGHPQQVFAYYASPGTLGGNSLLDRHLPAVVLVHGGGGKAFKEWVPLWAKKGYAAIAMDLRGNGADGKQLPGGFIEPGHQTPYFLITPSFSDQWMFQAVADVILAHNLIRHFPGVDSNRTAVTGISWGGVITCLVAGLDERYRAAVPVYGCGYLWESGRMGQQLDQLSPGDRASWIHDFDPSRYLRRASMPVLLLNDANDPYFVLESYRKTYDEIKDKNLCIKINLKHSHHAGWSNAEIFQFINHYLNGTAPLPRIFPTLKTGQTVRARVTPHQKTDRAFLNYATDTPRGGTTRKWVTVPARESRGMIRASAPPRGTTVWYFSLKDQNGLQVSAPPQFIKNDTQ